MRKISIIGAGNMGHVLAAKFSRNNDVCLYVNEFENRSIFYENIKVFGDFDECYEGKIKRITYDLKEAIEFGDLVFITYPAFLFETYAKKILPLLTNKHHLFFVPGSGGAELFFKDAINKGATITGLQRVHSVARIIEKGISVRESGIRNSLKAASIPNSFNKEACCILQELYCLPVEELDNYLNISLVNSNPILHTARLYSIFKDYPAKIQEYKSLPLFYEDWDIETSKLLIGMDSELFHLFSEMKKFNLNVNEIKPLLQHYESKNELEMVNKITSIQSLKSLTTPSIRTKNGGFAPDFQSRYFTADFPYGLDILISFCDFFGTPCDKMKIVSNWFHNVMGNKRVFELKSFFSSIDEIIHYYC